MKANIAFLEQFAQVIAQLSQRNRATEWEFWSKYKW